jgi:alpha-tubulin suppressor-like RCC1 family protein
VKFLAGGNNHTCAVTTTGAAWCWGQNYSGEVGSACGSDCSATQVPGVVNALRAVASTDYACAQFQGNTYQCWGTLPDGIRPSTLTARTDLAGAVVVAPGLSSSFDVQNDPTLITLCASFPDGTAKCSYGTTVTPYAVAGLANVKDVSVGRGHACALLKGGTIKCWGKNASGQLGNGTFNDSVGPVDVAGP